MLKGLSRMIKITERAEKELLPVLEENKDKLLRIVLQGFG